MDLDLSNYVRVATYDLPEPTRTSAPSGNLLAQEASGVTYNWDTNTLFVVGDGGTSVTQVSLTGQLIDTMTLAKGSSPQGTEFYDTEGITYIGGGKFVFTEERYRQVDEFTYAAGTTLTRADAHTVDLGTDIGNVGLEGISYDPFSGGYLVVKEKDPEGIFQTNIDFANGTASNGSSSTVTNINLFDPAKVGTSDLSDVYSLSSNASFVGGADESHMLILSQETGRIVEIGRDGTIYSSLDLVAPTVPSGIDLAAMTVEGITMGPDGTIYLVNEEGGGDADHPQLWVYKPASTTPNQAPTAIALQNATASILENTNTATRVKVADVSVTDDGQGTNHLSLTGADAALFEVDNTGLYLKAGTTLNYEVKTSYSVTVNVDDAAVGNTPDASTDYTLKVTNVVNEGPAGSVAITEVAPWSSSSPVGADWFELTNTGSSAIDLTGWKMDDNSYSFGSAVAMAGVSSLAPGESAIFLEGGAAQVTAFINTWFGGTLPAGLHIGTYSGSGVGLSTSGDAVNVFDSAGNLKASVTFGASPTGLQTFDNSAQLNSTSLTNHVTISALSNSGTNGAGTAANDASEIGSPGNAGGVPAPVNHAPTALGLTGEITNLPDDTSTEGRVKVASIIVTDDGLGTNNLSLSGADAASFEVDATGLYLKAGITLDATTKAHYDVTVNVDDPTVGGTPDASASYALDLSHVVANPIRITEVAAWSSGNSPVGADWFEVTNTGTSAVNIAGWKMDDNSHSFSNAVALSGITSIGAGESVIFIETSSTATVQSFIDTWFGGHAPAGLQIGTYSGSGVGLSTGGDEVNLFNAAGVLQTGVSFGASPSGPSFATFDNSTGLDNANVSTLSSVGTHGAFNAAGDSAEIGSPGRVDAATPPANTAPTAVTLANATASIQENTSTAAHIKVADIVVSDDGQGTNNLSLSGADAGSFEIQNGALYIKAGTTLDFETKAHYDVTVNVDDPTVGNTPDASINYTLNVADVANEGGAPQVHITEVAPWASSSPSGADWFELTNTGTSAANITGWKMDDNSFSFSSAVALGGISSIAAGESVIFVEGTAATAQTFINTWFGGNVPAGLQVGFYSGSGVGLSTGGDGVVIYDSTGAQQAKVSFGTSPSGPFPTFDNSAAQDNVTLTTLSSNGVNGAFHAAGDATETGSPGTITTPNQAPTAITLANATNAIDENSSTATHIKVADLVVTDDGKGTNGFSLSGADAGSFEIQNGSLYLKAGVALDFETKAHYDVTVNVDDPTVGNTPDASTNYTLNVNDVFEAPPPQVRITEVAPWSSGNSPVGADWFEVTNTGSAAVNMTGWKMDDNSFSFGSAVTLNGVSSIAAGESVIFIEGTAATAQSFIDTWFGGHVPAGFQIGYYSGSGVSLSTSGDGVALFDSTGAQQAKVSFGSSPGSAPFGTFENAAGLDNVTLTTLSNSGVNGAFHAAGDSSEIGSPGAIANPPNHAPVAGDDTGTALVEDSVLSATGTVVTNDTDADNDALSIAGIRAGAEAAGGSFETVSGATLVHGIYGDLTINLDGTFSYALANGSAAVQALNEGQHVSDVFTYQLSDGHGGLDAAQISFDVSGANEGPPLISGTEGVNTLNGTESADTLKGLGGDDKLFGNGGDDILNGGAGRDVLNGGEGIDTATYADATSGISADLGAGKGTYGEAIGDKFVDIENLSGSAFNDALFGDRFDNVLSGGDGDDDLEGIGGNDTLIGGKGSDTIIGGKGVDLLSGGEGADLFIFLKGDSGKTIDKADTILDFVSGVDKIDLTSIDAITKTKDVLDEFTFIGSDSFHKTAGELRYEVSGTGINLIGDMSGDGKGDFMIHLEGIGSLAANDFLHLV